MAHQADPVAQADREFHEATAHLYDDELLPVFDFYHELVVEPALDALAAQAPGREAADIGCGTGEVTLRIAQRGFQVQGIDHSPAMLSHAERKAGAAGVAERVAFVTGDVRELPWEDGSFDLLTCQGVLHHLPEFDDSVREFARVLRPGGRFLIAEPCWGSTLLLRLWDRGRARFARRGQAVPNGNEPEVPHHEEGPIDAEALRRSLDRHGLESRLDYWTHFEGAHRLPAPATRALIRWGSRPWRGRSGNLVYVTGFKRPAAAR